MKKFLIIFVAINVLLGMLAAGGLGGMLFLAETTPFGYSSPLYGIQTWAEDWRLRLSRDESRRAEFALKLVDRRLADLAHAADEEAVTKETNAVLDIFDEAIRAIDAAPLADQEALYARLDQLLIQAKTIVNGLVSTYANNATVLALSNRLAEFQEAETREDMVALVPPAPKITAEAIPFLSKQVEHTAFLLEGAHADVACEDCHTAGKYKGTPKECTDCHRPPANGVYAAHFEGACVDCHTVDSWDPYQFNHIAVVECESCHLKDRPLAHYDPPDPSIKYLAAVSVRPVTLPTATPLGDDVHTDACIRCHTDTTDWNTYTFDHFGFTDCTSCHLDDAAPAQHYAGQCSNCHTPSTWEEATFNHTGFTNCATCHAAPTPAHYTGYACATCHISSAWTPAVFTHTGVEDCATCHSGAKPTAHYDGQCASCHNTGDWTAATFNHAGATDCLQCHQTPTIHWQAGCTNCHNTENWLETHFSHNGLTDCKSCHSQSDHYSGQCSNCHNTHAWPEVNFNHGDLTTCVTCHAEDLPPMHYTGSCDTCHSTRSWGDASYNHDNAGPCATCHSDVLPPNHYSGDCALCHNVDRWDNISFNHVGAVNCTTCHSADKPASHYTAECSLCHTTVSWAFVHQGLDSDCQSCHTYAGHWPGQCSDCHLSVSDWLEYKFDHTGYTDCKACHTRPDNHPRGQCSKCHNTDSWTNDITMLPDEAAAPAVAPERPGSTTPTTPPVAAPVAAPSR